MLTNSPPTPSHLIQVVPRFNERFILSLSDCTSCLVLDDELNILPLSSHVQYIPKHESEMLGKSEEGREIRLVACVC